MKKTFKKLIAVVLCFTLIGCVSAPVAFAAFDPEVSVSEEVNPVVKVLYNVVDVIIDKVVGVINGFIPDPADWVSAEDYDGTVAMAGMETFLDEAADGAYWSLGYANASILTGNEMDGKHFVGGSLSFSDKTVTSVMDDLMVRTVALSDNSGRGTVVFAVIDAYGLANPQVNIIRDMMADYCEENNIVSLNIAVMHQHSAVDTLGMNGSIIKALGNFFTEDDVNGLNDEYMANLRNVVVASVEAAVEDMTAGTLYYGNADFSEFVTDKRDPQVLASDFDRFRFVPADGSEETWFTTSAIHCVGNGAGSTDLTGDYPYYMEQYINEKYNANFIMILGAEQGTSQDKDSLELADDLTTPERLTAYAEALTERFASIENEVVVEPVLNIKHAAATYEITNQILVFAAKAGLLTNGVLVADDHYEVISEIGYMEIGTDIAVILCPGEIAAELVYGGCLGADKSWTGTEWTYDYIGDMTGKDTVIVFGIINDQIGYIIPSNDYMALLEPSNKSLELVSTGNVTAPSMVEDFAELIASVK